MPTKLKPSQKTRKRGERIAIYITKRNFLTQ